LIEWYWLLFKIVELVQPVVVVFCRAQRVPQELQAIYYMPEWLSEALVHFNNRVTVRPVVTSVIGRHEFQIGRLEKSTVIGEEVVLAPIYLKLTDGQMNHRAQWLAPHPRFASNSRCIDQRFTPSIGMAL